MDARGALWVRVASGLVLAPVLLIPVYLGSPWLPILVTAGVIVLAWEWVRMCRGATTSALLCGLFAAGCVIVAAHGRFDGVLLALVAGSVATLAVGRGNWWPALGVVYIGLPAAVFVWLRGDAEAGLLTVLWLLASVWAYDTGAYSFGRWIGGPKLVPAISPQKTWAGFIGGTACAAVAGPAVVAALGEGVHVILAPMSGIIGIAAQAGDIFESAVKRRFGVKDASGLIPGHGGLLDRVDGLIAATIVAALIVIISRGSIDAWM